MLTSLYRLPATDNKLQEIKTTQENDPTCIQLKYATKMDGHTNIR